MSYWYICLLLDADTQYTTRYYVFEICVIGRPHTIVYDSYTWIVLVGPRRGLRGVALHIHACGASFTRRNTTIYASRATDFSHYAFIGFDRKQPTNHRSPAAFISNRSMTERTGCQSIDTTVRRRRLVFAGGLQQVGKSLACPRAFAAWRAEALVVVSTLGRVPDVPKAVAGVFE